MKTINKSALVRQANNQKHVTSPKLPSDNPWVVSWTGDGFIQVKPVVGSSVYKTLFDGDYTVVELIKVEG